jgi:hypothetical protein
VQFLDRLLRASLRPIAIGVRIEVRFKDWFQQQLGGGLHHPVPDRRNPERPLAATGLRDHYPSHRLWLIRLRAKVLSDVVQPFLQPQRFDSPEGLPIHTRRALIGLHQCISMVTIYPVTIAGTGVGYLAGITTGPDGALWFGAGQAIGRITMSGAISYFPLSSNVPSRCSPSPRVLKETMAMETGRSTARSKA